MTALKTDTPAKRGRPAKVSAEPKADETILIHFVKDGLSAFGTVWLAGQELEVTRGSAEFQDTCSRFGKSWLDESEADQASTGAVMFKHGPSDIPNPIINYTQHLNEKIDFYGVSNATGSYLSLAAKKAAAEKEIARGRSVPVREW